MNRCLSDLVKPIRNYFFNGTLKSTMSTVRKTSRKNAGNKTESKFINFILNHTQNALDSIKFLVGNYQAQCIVDKSLQKLNDIDLREIYGSAHGIYGKFFEMMFEYIIKLKRALKPGFNESTFAYTMYDEFREEYEQMVKDGDRIFKDMNYIEIEAPDVMFKNFAIMSLEVSYWKYWHINLNEKNKDNNLRKLSVYIPGLSSILYSNYRELAKKIKEDDSLARGIKPFLFSRLKNPIFEDLLNPKYLLAFNWKYRTFNYNLKTSSEIKEFDIVVFDPTGEKMKVTRIYELKFNSQHASHMIEDIKKHATCGPIKIFKYRTDIEYECEHLETVFTIFNFLNQYIRTI